MTTGLGPYPPYLSADSVRELEALDREDTLAEFWAREDRERERAGREIELSEFATKREREAA